MTNEEFERIIQQQQKQAFEGTPHSDRCPFCQSADISMNVCDGNWKEFRLYHCQTCHQEFDTPIEGRK